MWVTDQLLQTGLSTEETEAQLPQIQNRLLKALPVGWLESVQAGILGGVAGIEWLCSSRMEVPTH